ncbi:MAG: ATP-binding cassette domain-containing protein [Flavobacteriales bacterium]
MSIEVSSLHKNYGNQKALKALDFKIGSSEIVGLLGPNGAGKSTLMKIISTYLPQSSGEVKVCGLNTETDSFEIKKNLGYLPEHNPLYLDMYVKEYLQFIAKLYHLPKSSIEEVIEMTGLQKEYRKKIQALSKGYRQRVGLAQALIHQPKVLILDEPTTGLDPNQLVDIRALIRNVGKERTVLLSTHIMQEVDAICDRVMIINQGELVADAPTEDLKRIQNNEKRLKVGFQHKVDLQDIQNISGVEHAERIKNNQWLLQVDQSDVNQNLFQFCADTKNYLTHLELEDRGLEAVFRQLTN